MGKTWYSPSNTVILLKALFWFATKCLLMCCTCTMMKSRQLVHRLPTYPSHIVLYFQHQYQQCDANSCLPWDTSSTQIALFNQYIDAECSWAKIKDTKKMNRYLMQIKVCLFSISFESQIICISILNCFKQGEICLLIVRKHFFGRIQEGILQSKKEFCIYSQSRLIQDHSDHGASKEPKNPCPEWILWFLWCTTIQVTKLTNCTSKKKLLWGSYN